MGPSPRSCRAAASPAGSRDPEEEPGAGGQRPQGLVALQQGERATGVGAEAIGTAQHDRNVGHGPLPAEHRHRGAGARVQPGRRVGFDQCEAGCQLRPAAERRGTCLVVARVAGVDEDRAEIAFVPGRSAVGAARAASGRGRRRSSSNVPPGAPAPRSRTATTAPTTMATTRSETRPHQVRPPPVPVAASTSTTTTTTPQARAPTTSRRRWRGDRSSSKVAAHPAPRGTRAWTASAVRTSPRWAGGRR